MGELLPWGIAALVLLAIATWRLVVKQGAELDWLQLFVMQDPLGAPLKAASRPSFNMSVHQLGFALFPFGALVPVAFASLLWEKDECVGGGREALALWFALGFLAPALTVTHSGLGFFLAPAAVAREAPGGRVALRADETPGAHEANRGSVRGAVEGTK